MSGAAGGGASLSGTVELVFCLDVRHHRLRLEAAVLLRGARPGWQHLPAPPNRIATNRPRVPGGGSSAGRHGIFVDTQQHVIWINESITIPLNEFNVVMLDKADDATNPPILHGTCTIDPNLGAVPQDPLGLAAAMRNAVEHLKQRLEQSPPVSSFVHF